MRAPEKLYLRKRNKLPLEVVRGGEWSETDPQCMYGSVEYLRTDVFVKKVEDFLYDSLLHGDMDCSNITKLVENFKKRIKGE